MSEVYSEKPEVLEVSVLVDGDKLIERYIVGKSATDIEVAIIDALSSLVVKSESIVIEKKARKPRRTKQQMAEVLDTAEVPKSTGKAWAD